MTVVVERGALGRLGPLLERHAPAHRYAVVADATVAALYADAVVAQLPAGRAVVATFAAGERHKTRETWGAITDRLLEAGCGRDTVVLALGGGVAGDLGGFVAATFMRGLPVVQLPTTLLAMVDASLGGKTGVDTPAGKNLVGAFHPPALVVADPAVLATLPLPELRAGLAEVIKHGVVADDRYFDEVADGVAALLAPGGATADAMVALVARSVEIKLAVVAADEREGGRRKVLNFGHTIGHAVELVSGFAMLHGEAVAVGMALEADLAEVMGVAECGTAARVREALGRAGLAAALPAGMSAEAVLEATRGDKKARAGQVEYALPRRIGAMAGEASGWAVAVADDRVREVLA